MVRWWGVNQWEEDIVCTPLTENVHCLLQAAAQGVHAVKRNVGNQMPVDQLTPFSANKTLSNTIWALCSPLDDHAPGSWKTGAYTRSLENGWICRVQSFYVNPWDNGLTRSHFVCDQRTCKVWQGRFLQCYCLDASSSRRPPFTPSTLMLQPPGTRIA